MTEPTDAELDELRQANSGRLNFVTLSEFRTIARAVLAKWGQPAQAAEPVAWLDPWTGTKVTTDYDAYGKHGIPLYTAPQPVAREPLTDEQIEALPLWKRFVGLWPETRREIVRIIESAHGIGIKGGQHGAE